MHVVSIKAPQFRSPIARAVGPVLGGIAFFALIGLLTWGIAAYLSNGNAQTTDNLAPSRLDLGGVTDLANEVSENGPLLFSELATITGRRSLVVDHEGGDPAAGWRIYYAYPVGRPDCPVTQIRDTATFVDCDGNELDVSELSPPAEAIRPVVENERTLYLDLRAFSTTPNSTPTT
jgi:hypothetical protein